MPVQAAGSVSCSCGARRPRTADLGLTSLVDPRGARRPRTPDQGNRSQPVPCAALVPWHPSGRSSSTKKNVIGSCLRCMYAALSIPKACAPGSTHVLASMQHANAAGYGGEQPRTTKYTEQRREDLVAASCTLIGTCSISVESARRAVPDQAGSALVPARRQGNPRFMVGVKSKIPPLYIMLCMLTWRPEPS
jgi:hypothetical protein